MLAIAPCSAKQSDMKCSIHDLQPIKLVSLLLFLATAGFLRGAEGQTKPVLLYSRYFNAEGETRYLPDGNYKDVLTRVRTDFEVRIDNKPLTPENLADVKLVLIANPSDKAVGDHPSPP